MNGGLQKPQKNVFGQKNVLARDTNDSTDSHEFLVDQISERRGKLTFEPQEIKPTADMETFIKQDPYLKVTYADQEFQTKVLEQKVDSNINFDEVFELDIDAEVHPHLTIEICGNTTAESKTGTGRIFLTDLSRQREAREWIDVRSGQDILGRV